MVFMTKICSDFDEATKFRDTLEKYGARDLKTYASWSRREKSYIIKVTGTLG